jgi:hypothetical protein
MSEDQSKSERIEEILVDTYDEYEQVSAWEVAFQDEVQTPFPATLFGAPVKVQGFQVGDNEALQCQVVGKGRTRWIGIEDLGPEGLPDDFADILGLYQAWRSGDYQVRIV